MTTLTQRHMQIETIKDLRHHVDELSERDFNGHEEAIDRAIRIIESVVQSIDDGDGT